MRSRRSRFEIGCRIAAFGLLGWLLGDSLIPSTARRLERAATTELPARLAVWTRAPSSTALHATFATTPQSWVVDWLAALRHSNHAVSWSGSPPPIAVVAEALADPAGGVRVDIAAPQGSRVLLSDGGGAIDSITIGGFGASAVMPVAIGAIDAQVGGQHAAIAEPSVATARSIVVTGGAGWEGKFIVSALEERGWPVVAKFSVAPGVDVAQGMISSLDTARVAAVIVVDSVARESVTTIERFVRSGGGLVLVGAAAASSALRSLAPGSVGARTRPAVHPSDTIRLGTTGFYPVAALNASGISLERRREGIALAARRIGAGRVLQVGYDDSWRWRMAGVEGSERAHREWWSRVAGSVAYVPHQTSPVAAIDLESAPLARLVDRLGPSHAPPPNLSGRAPLDERLLLVAIMILLIAEWGSRRLRGLR